MQSSSAKSGTTCRKVPTRWTIFMMDLMRTWGGYQGYTTYILPHRALKNDFSSSYFRPIPSPTWYHFRTKILWWEATCTVVGATKVQVRQQYITQWSYEWPSQGAFKEGWKIDMLMCEKGIFCCFDIQREHLMLLRQTRSLMFISLYQINLRIIAKKYSEITPFTHKPRALMKLNNFKYSYNQPPTISSKRARILLYTSSQNGNIRRRLRVRRVSLPKDGSPLRRFVTVP